MVHTGMRLYYTYITTNRKRGLLYTGMTNHLRFRIWQHKTKQVKGFTSRYNLDKLVWYESFEQVQDRVRLLTDAIAREKEIKGWRREKKIALIESMNPEWKDLYDML